MALSSGTVWFFNASATASMVNGGGFNTGNTSFMTDLACDTGTGNTSSPVVSSATYNFVAGDVGAWVYIKSGTNWTPGFYEITSVAANKATLKAAVGEASQYSATLNRYHTNTVAGCATTGTPTGGTFGIDYSRGTATIATNTDLTCTAASTTVTSASAPFTRSMIGNIIHLTALTGTGAIVGWYEVVSFTDTSNVVLDRTPTNGVNNITAGTFYVGGALSLNSTLDDDFFEAIVGGNFVFFKNGTYSVGETISVASTSSTVSNPTHIIGYSTVPGDNPSPYGVSSTAPTINYGATAVTFGQYMNFEYLIATGTSSAGFSTGNHATVRYVKCLNTSTSGGRSAYIPGPYSFNYAIEAVSQLGVGINCNGDLVVFASYVHDCNVGIQMASQRCRIINCLVLSCRTSGISAAAAAGSILGNTIYGYATPRGTGISISASVNAICFNNIISGWTTGINQATAIVYASLFDYNAFYGNTTDYSLCTSNAGNIIGTNPQFTNVAELTGSTATTSGSVLTQSGGDFSTVTDNVDYIQIHSGAGVTVGSYLITSHTSTTVTLNIAPGTNATADKIWTVRTGNNLIIGSNLKGLGFPGSFDSTGTIGYMDPGAAQRQEQTQTLGATKKAGSGGGAVG